MQLGSLSVDGATQEMLAILSGPFLMSWPTLESLVERVGGSIGRISCSACDNMQLINEREYVEDEHGFGLRIGAVA